MSMPTTFDTWLGSLPKWLQTGAADLLTNQKPDDKGIPALADLCVAEAKKEPATFKVVPAGAFDTPAAGVTVRLRGINSVKGVNALDPTAALQFGDADIAVVYGHNGTGKSGFARLTKEAASGPRARSRILPDVFAANNTEPQATFVVQRDGQEIEAVWKQSADPVAELRHLHVFDRDVALSYMNDKAEARYEPRRLRFISALADLCDRVRDELQGRVSALPTVLPTITVELAGTPLANVVSNLKPGMSDDDLRKKVQRAANHADRMRELEAALKAPDPDARIKAINKALGDLDALTAMVVTLTEALSVGGIKSITSAKERAITMLKAATQAAALTFEQSSLPGVGEAVWKVMWEAARDYSTQVAYQEHPFPHVDGALCPLCQQALGPEASRRMVSFEEFIKGEVEAKAKEAETLHERLVQGLPKLPALVDWKARFSVLPDGEQLVETVHQAAAAALAVLGAARSADEVAPVEFTPLLEALRVRRASLEMERTLLGTTQKEGERQKLEAELRALKMLDWCNDNLPALLKALVRKKKIAVLDVALKTTNTAALTKKKNKLAEDELTGGYQRRFEQEMKALGAARIRVKPVEAKGAKGRVTFGLAITGAKTAVPPADVLSEGEARVVALAAFLADVTVAGATTPFLFDDPVSSLDIEFEEKVVDRLIALAKTRQVLVFTHRLSLLTLLGDAAKKENIAASRLDGKPPVRFKQVALRRIEGRIGLTTDTSVLESKVDKALNNLLGARLPAAKKVADAGDVDTYTALMKGICSDVRILAERAVEEELLSGVVVRFRRSVMTKDKLTLLAKINGHDCLLIDGIMTRFSAFEHSQPPEMPTTLPSYEDVAADARALEKWVIEFRTRGAGA